MTDSLTSLTLNAIKKLGSLFDSNSTFLGIKLEL